ncbi:hypothetical protein [Flavisericum labens]|uniref:hypothetical protein n=1 Tax=Flavisericum labens TaxID=3377112 RepID=UPI00387AFDF2
MRNNYLLIFFLLITFLGFSQQPDIDNGNWFLIHLHFNSENYNRPIRADGGPIITEITSKNNVNAYFSTRVCDTWFGDVLIDSANSKITFYGFGSTLGGCIPVEDYVENFDNDFAQFFQADISEGTKFEYQLIEENLDQPRELIITDYDDNYARYYFNTLNTKKTSSAFYFSIFLFTPIP